MNNSPRIAYIYNVSMSPIKFAREKYAITEMEGHLQWRAFRTFHYRLWIASVRLWIGIFYSKWILLPFISNHSLPDWLKGHNGKNWLSITKKPFHHKTVNNPFSSTTQNRVTAISNSKHKKIKWENNNIFGTYYFMLLLRASPNS